MMAVVIWVSGRLYLCYVAAWLVARGAGHVGKYMAIVLTG